MKNNVVVVVVTFNRKKLLVECITSLIKSNGNYIKKIIIVDNNSTDGTYEYLKNHIKFNTLIDYHFLKTNLGGAGGFNYGIKKALVIKPDWIWVMDDDAEVFSDSLFNLLKYCKPNYSGLAGLQMGNNSLPQLSHRGFFSRSQQYPLPINFNNVKQFQEIDYSSFVGLLINSKAISKVGLPRKDFFIWFDDLEYCMRLKKYGSIMYVPVSKILHKDEQVNLKVKKFLNREIISVTSEMQWKFIIGFRNFLVINKIYFNKTYIWFIYMLIKKLIKVILFDQYTLKIIFLYFHFWLQAVGLIKFNNEILKR